MIQERVTNGSTSSITQYTYGLERISAINSTNNTKTQYVYDGRTSVAQTITGQIGSKVTGLAAQGGTNSNTDTSANVNTNTGLPNTNPKAALTAANSTPQITSFTYTPFGEQLGKVGNEKITGFGFNGEYYDGATGMLNLRARQYEPTMNRFSQKDLLRGTLEHPLSQNRYGFVWNNPIALIDPNGLAATSSSMYGQGQRATAVLNDLSAKYNKIMSDQKQSSVQNFVNAYEKALKQTNNPQHGITKQMLSKYTEVYNEAKKKLKNLNKQSNQNQSASGNKAAADKVVVTEGDALWEACMRLLKKEQEEAKKADLEKIYQYLPDGTVGFDWEKIQKIASGQDPNYNYHDDRAKVTDMLYKVYNSMSDEDIVKFLSLGIVETGYNFNLSQYPNFLDSLTAFAPPGSDLYLYDHTYTLSGFMSHFITAYTSYIDSQIAALHEKNKYDSLTYQEREAWDSAQMRSEMLKDYLQVYNTDYNSSNTISSMEIIFDGRGYIYSFTTDRKNIGRIYSFGDGTWLSHVSNLEVQGFLTEERKVLGDIISKETENELKDLLIEKTAEKLGEEVTILAGKAVAGQVAKKATAGAVFVAGILIEIHEASVYNEKLDKNKLLSSIGSYTTAFGIEGQLKIFNGEVSIVSQQIDTDKLAASIYTYNTMLGTDVTLKEIWDSPSLMESYVDFTMKSQKDIYTNETLLKEGKIKETFFTDEDLELLYK